jgi:hypothetical protein
MALGKLVKARVCKFLHETSEAPFFDESFFVFCQKHIAFGDHDQAWREEMNKRRQAGEEVYGLDNPDHY